MIKIRFIAVCFLVAILAAGCGVAKRSVKTSRAHASPPNKTKDQPRLHHSPHSLPAAMSVSKINEIKASLNQAYRDWKGTPYDLGGDSQHGIDCSALMQRIFRRYFGVKIPRTTRRQLRAGRAIRRQDLQTGDLVFFKTGRRTLHVGVMVVDQRFLHASTSRGVTMSSLDNYYWKSRYLAARRVLKVQ